MAADGVGRLHKFDHQSLWHWQMHHKTDAMFGNRGDAEASLVAKAAAYRLLRIMYLALPVMDIKETILGPFGGHKVGSASCPPSSLSGRAARQ